MRTTILITLVAALCAGVSAWAQTTAPGGPIVVELEQADQQRLGVAASELQAAEVAATEQALGQVLDTGPLAQLDSAVAVAVAAAAASNAEARRVASLAADNQNASQRALETARAKAEADAAELRLARQRLALEWGPGLAKLEPAARGALLEAIAAGRAALLRIDPLRADGAVSGTVSLRPDPSQPSIATESLGPAARVDPRMQTPALLAMVRGSAAADLRPGRVVAAEIDSGRRETGVIIPRSALVRTDGATWAYLQVADDRFERREVTGGRVVDAGWFLGSGFQAGERVVDHGAGSLLAVERVGRSTATAAEDDDD